MAFVPGYGLRAVGAGKATPRMCNTSPRRRTFRSVRPNAPITPTTSSAEAPAPAAVEGANKVKEFLDSLGGLGKVRLVQNNGVTVLESIAPLDGLFYATVRGAEYGNVIDHKINVDLHIKVEAVKGARFEIGKSRTNPPSPTYAIRLLGNDDSVVLSMFIQWDKDPSDVEPQRIACWQQLKDKYATDGDTARF